MPGMSRATGSLRAQAFLDAWRDPSVQALVAVRGGYGSVHVLPLLDREDLRRTPKAFIGYSDLTTVLTYLTTLLASSRSTVRCSIGGSGRGVEGYDRDSFVRALTQAEPLGELGGADARDVRTRRSGGSADGRDARAARGVARHALRVQAAERAHVLFLEDVGERPYRLDRMLTQLRLAGVSTRHRPIVLGEFKDCDEPRRRAVGEGCAGGTC